MKIYKYPLTQTIGTINIPANYRVVKVDVDLNGQYSMWVMVNPDEKTLNPFSYIVIGTGQFVPDGATYLGTINDQGFMWHIFEISQKQAETIGTSH